MENTDKLEKGAVEDVEMKVAEEEDWVSDNDANWKEAEDSIRDKLTPPTEQATEIEEKPAVQVPVLTEEKENPEVEKKVDEIDAILQKLLSVQHKPPGTMVDLKVKQIEMLVERSLKIIRKEKMLLHLSAPLTIGTDIHG